MPSIILPSRWRQQPNYPVQLRAGGLGAGVHAAVLPIGGALVDLARRQVISTTFNSPDIIQAAGGRQARVDSYNEAWESPFSTTPGAMSLGWLGDFLGAATDAGGVFGVTHSSDSGAVPYIANTLKRSDSGGLYYQFNNAGSYNQVFQSSVGTSGRKSLVGTCTSGAQQVYVDGVAGVSASYSGAIQFGSGSRLFVGEDYRLASRNGNVGMFLGVVWGRALSQQEVLAFYRAPYGELFVPHRRVLYFETAGGSTVALGQAAETDTAQAITFVPGAISVPLGQAAETDTAQAVTVISGVTTVTLGQALEIDSAQSIIFVPGAISVALGQAAETDTAQTITPTIGATVVNIGLVTEIDTSQAITFVPGAINVAVGQAAETDLAQTITASVPGETTLTAADLNAIFGYEIEPGVTLLSALRIMFAPFAGKREGLGTATERYMAQDGIKPRITFSPTDAAGNGTPIVDGG